MFAVLVKRPDRRRWEAVTFFGMMFNELAIGALHQTGEHVLREADEWLDKISLDCQKA